MSDSAARLITLDGPGGVGKTRLALELARAIAEGGAARVVFVTLAAIRDPASSRRPSPRCSDCQTFTAIELPRRARAACANSLDAAGARQFRAGAGGRAARCGSPDGRCSLRLLATSRAPLRMRGEREYAVGPLALDAGLHAVSSADMARPPAVRLFLERVRDVQPDFRLTPTNAPTVTAICRRLDALPLALELAAPWIKVLYAEELLSPT